MHELKNYVFNKKITRNIKKYINLIFFKLNIIIKITQAQLKKQTASLPVFVLCLYVFWFWQLLYYPLLSCYFSKFLQDWPYVTLLSAFLVPFLSFSFFSLFTWVCGTDGTHRELLLIAWVWSFVVFVPLILLLCKSFPLMICFFFLKKEEN